jgi:hypothetical protein
MTSSPIKARPLKTHRVRAGEKVELRLASRKWVSVVKPKCHRGRFYIDHLRSTLAMLESQDIPATRANIRRLACGRGPRLTLALAMLEAEKANEASVETIDK